MSAFTVSRAHIATLAAYYVEHVTARYPIEQIADTLLKENVRSVNVRYNEKTKAKPFTHDEAQRLAQKVSAAQIFKACHCYDYQACETDDYEESAAKAFVNSIVCAAARNVEGYEDAKWEIT